MFGRKKNKQPDRKQNPAGDKVAGKVAGFIVKIQSGFAGFLGRKTAGLQRRGKIALLIIICIVFGGLSLSSVLDVFWGTQPGKQSLKPESIKVPRHYDKTGAPRDDDTPVITEDVIIKIQQFRHYMDSLQQSKRGKQMYDSIISTRPGLMDSIQIFEQIYLQQKN